MNSKHYYLQQMGITAWQLRSKTKKLAFYKFQLFWSGKEFGYLIASKDSSQPETKELELLSAINKALNLEIREVSTLPEKIENIIVFGKELQKEHSVTNSGKILATISLAELLLHPEYKKQFWKDCQNFF